MARGRSARGIPKPDAEKRLAGTFRADRAGKKGALAPLLPAAPRAPGQRPPPPPKTLHAKLKPIWTDFAEMVEAAGTYTPADLGAFQQLVESQGVVNALLTGVLDGQPSNAYTAATVRVSNLLTAFGLTPLSRGAARVEAPAATFADQGRDPDDFAVIPFRPN